MIRIGTSGFSYDDWIGCFYPEHIGKSDMLAHYARQFDTVEINSSYYTIPGPRSFAGMARKTPDNFDFMVKAHKDMTHVESLERDVFDRFLESISPLREADKLGCVLAQFPWGFKCTRENSEMLRKFKDMIGAVPTVVEFRNADWVNDDTFGPLRELDLGFCSVDEPHLKGLMPPVVVATSDIGYVRFHGRNAAKWWSHEESYERYDYLYSEQELMEWMPKIMDLTSKVQKVYLFFNNHYRGQSATNAKMFSRMLGLDPPLMGLSSTDGQMTFGDEF
jgi:uncharacterized protein YecE (DUF72 family)